MASADRDSAVTVGSGWFTRKRYGSPAAVVGSVVAFVMLLCFAAYTIAESAFLMSNHCFDSGGQTECPTSGPEWARPLPGAATLLGLLAGLGGVLAGRPVRVPALIGGFLFVAGGLVGSWLMSPT